MWPCVCYVLTEKRRYLVFSRLWKRGVPAIRTWHRLAEGKQNWFRHTQRLEYTVLYFRAMRLIGGHVQVCLCMCFPQNPDGSSKPLADSLPHEAYLILPLYTRQGWKFSLLFAHFLSQHIHSLLLRTSSCRIGFSVESEGVNS